MCKKLPIFLGILLLFVQYVFVDASIAILESKANRAVTIQGTMKTAPVLDPFTVGKFYLSH